LNRSSTISITPDVEPENYDHYNDLEWEDWVALIGSNIYTTKTRPKLWAYLRDEMNMQDTVDALNELRIAQEEIMRGKKSMGNASWRNTEAFVFQITARLQGCKNRRHDREVAQLKNRIRTLEAQVASYEQAA